MADKPKPKTASPGKAKAKKPADTPPAKSADAPKAATAKTAAAKTATAKTATAKTAAKAGKKAKTKSGKSAAGASAAKPAKSEPPATAKHAAKHGAALAETFYVCSGPLPLEIRDTPPASRTPHVEFSSFAAARDNLLDQLIEAIEHYERVLHAVRGTASFADYREQQG
jgi:hypothetical protein